MDPGRFVAQHQRQFLILGFHDEERSDQDFEVRSDEEAAVAMAAMAPHHHPGGGPRLSFSSALRNTLSPVREHHGDASFADQARVKIYF